MRKNLVTLAAVSGGAATMLVGCGQSPYVPLMPVPFRYNPSASPSTTMHAAPFGQNCAPVKGHPNQCTLPVSQTGAAGCLIVHEPPNWRLVCDASKGWRPVNIPGHDDSGCYTHPDADTICGDGFRKENGS